MNEESPALSIRSVERAFGVVDVLAQEPGPMGLIEIARRMDLPRTTVHRLLSTLVRLGWVEQRGSRSGYQLSEHMLGIAALALTNNSLVQYGRTVLARFSAVTKLNSYLAVLERGRLVFLASVHGQNAPPFDFQVGMSHPAHATAGGRVLLAYMDPAERAAVVPPEISLHRFTNLTITDRNQLEADLEHVRVQGYAIDRGEHISSRCAVAAPVRGVDGRVRSALVCTVPVDQVDEERLMWIRNEMLPLAAELSGLLGSRPD